MRNFLLIFMLIGQFSYAADMVNLCRSPDDIGALHLSSPNAFNEKYKKYKFAIFEELKKSNVSPEDFYVKISEDNSRIYFALWHKSAFYPENCAALGNPGGLCRTYVIENGKIVSTLGWL